MSSTMNIIRKMKNSIFAMPAAAAAILVNPKRAAIMEITKKISAHRNMPASLCWYGFVYMSARVQTVHRLFTEIHKFRLSASNSCECMVIRDQFLNGPDLTAVSADISVLGWHKMHVRQIPGIMYFAENEKAS
jgi:hypothetical protein